MSERTGVRVIGLEAENTKRVRAVRIMPKGDLIKVAGANAAGKSSLLDTIEMLLAGKDHHAAAPIRQGATSARAVGTFGGRDGKPSFTVTRKWTGKNTYLEVSRADGGKVASPQAFLDGLIGAGFGVDPGAFLRLKPVEQVNTLLGVLRLEQDPRALDAQRIDVASQRTTATRELKALEARFEAMPAPTETTPDVEVSVSALADELDRLNAVKEDQRRIRQAVADVRKVVDQGRGEVGRLEAALEKARTDLVKAEALLSEGEAKITALIEPDTTSVMTRMREAESVNITVRQKVARRTLAEQVVAKQKEVDVMTVAIRRLDDRKTEVLAKAEFPIEGLGFEVVNGGYAVTYHGIPLTDCAQSERIRVAMGIAMALNPSVRVVLIREGSLLDERSLETVREMAEAHDFQCWVEIVGQGDATAFLIEDGEVVREPSTLPATTDATGDAQATLV